MQVYRCGSVGARSGTCKQEPLSGILPLQRDLLFSYLDAVLVFNRHTNLTGTVTLSFSFEPQVKALIVNKDWHVHRAAISELAWV